MTNERIWSYIDGTLTPQEHEAFERELASSETLRVEVESARTLMSALSHEELRDTSRHFTHNVLVEVSRQEALALKPKRSTLRFAIPTIITVAAIIVVAIIIAPSTNGSPASFSVRGVTDSIVGFFTSGVSSMLVAIITCGYILVWLDKVVRRRILGK
jgi:anti-sigma factor RsiW